MFYRAYTYLTELILVLQNLDMYFRSYTCLTEHILILRSLYWYYKTYSYLTDLIITPVGTTEFIIIRNLNGDTRRYDKSEQIRFIQIHIRYGH